MTPEFKLWLYTYIDRSLLSLITCNATKLCLIQIFITLSKKKYYYDTQHILTQDNQRRKMLNFHFDVNVFLPRDE